MLYRNIASRRWLFQVPQELRSQLCKSRPTSAPTTSRRYTASTTTGSNGTRKARTIFSGIQPTGVPHLGNYLGALREWKRLQETAHGQDELKFCLVDLHALTLYQPPEQLRQWRKESLAVLLAIGLDPKRCNIYYQSAVPAHTQLHYLLSCQAGMGYLQRMTGWKEKTAQMGADKQKLGLFSYPVLQAADILLHSSEGKELLVPVGDDQAQHLEFTRHLAESFNHTFSTTTLTPPETFISPAKRIMSLNNPAKKMSKSDPNPKSRILLTDSSADIQSKIAGALTDSVEGISYDPESRPGVSNLIDLLYYLGDGQLSRERLVTELKNVPMKGLKEITAAAVEVTISPIRDRYMDLVSDERKLRDVADEGAESARIAGTKIIQDVSSTIGID